MTKMTRLTNERRVSDLTLASFFANRRHQIVRIEGDGGRSIFIFRATPELEQDELAFFNRTAAVEPLAFAETLRYLKGAVR